LLIISNPINLSVLKEAVYSKWTWPYCLSQMVPCVMVPWYDALYQGAKDT